MRSPLLVEDISRNLEVSDEQMKIRRWLCRWRRPGDVAFRAIGYRERDILVGLFINVVSAPFHKVRAAVSFKVCGDVVSTDLESRPLPTTGYCLPASLKPR